MTMMQMLLVTAAPITILVFGGLIYFGLMVKRGGARNTPTAPAGGAGQPAQNNPPAANVAGGNHGSWNLLMVTIALAILAGAMVFLNWWFPTMFSNINIPWPAYGIAIIIAVLILAAFIDNKTGKGAGK